MKRLIMIIAVSGGLLSGPALADHDGEPLLNRENIGGALGATVGGFIGSRFGDGDGRLATTAIGAVGGYIVGKDIGHNYGGNRGYEPRRTGSYQGGGYTGRTNHATCCNHDGGQRSRIDPIHETFVATCTSNVRAGPSTRYHVVGQLHNRERVRVVGKVRGRNWYLVRNDHREGFVYAPLLRPAQYGYSNY